MKTENQLEVKTKQQDIENDLKSALRVPDRLTNPDELIVPVRDYFNNKRNHWSRKGLIRSYHHLNIEVSEQNVSRALRIMDTLIKCLKKRGHRIEIGHTETEVIIGDEKIGIHLKEKLKRTTVKGRFQTKEYEFAPTGILMIKLHISHWYIELMENKVPLENQLSIIIARLEVEGRILKEERILREASYKLWEEEQERLRILKKKKEKELEDFRELLQTAKRWKEAAILREYLDAIRPNASNPEWLSWAEQKADWYDPTIKLEDQILGHIDNVNLS